MKKTQNISYKDFLKILNQYTHINQDIIKTNKEIRDFINIKKSIWQDKEIATFDITSLFCYHEEMAFLRDKINYLIDLKKVIDLILMTLTINERKIIEMRHFEGKSWELISGFVFYSREWLPKIEKKIVQKMMDEFLRLSPKFKYLSFINYFKECK